MKTRFLCFAVLTGLLAGSAVAELPAHAARTVSPKKMPEYETGLDGRNLDQHWTLAFVYMPSIEDDRFEDPLGVELAYNWLHGKGIGLKSSVGFEFWDEDDAGGIGDADIVPIGLSLLFAPGMTRGVNATLETGIRYLVIDLADYDDAFTGVVALGIDRAASAWASTSATSLISTRAKTERVTNSPPKACLSKLV